MATAGPLDAGDATRASDPLIGAQLGEYTVLSVLGRGAMGVVYRGEQKLIGKPVAIKVLQGSAGLDPSQMKKLLDEARAISAARHPNIIDIFSFGTAPTGQQYFVMECLDGDPLDVHLQEQGMLAPEEVAKLLQQVTAALSAAHAAGVVHRDLKPSNIFLARLGDGTRFVKLLDFGLAKRTAPNAGARPTANQIVGTALYMAPELVTGEEIGPWTDLYAVGVIAHELLTGQVPFPGTNIIEVLGHHASTPPRPLRQIDPSIPEALETLVLELLEKAPSRRPKSAAIVRKALERIERTLATARTRGTGLKSLGGVPTVEVRAVAGAVPRMTRIAPTRISAPRLSDPDFEGRLMIEPTQVSAERLGPVPEHERPTRTSKTQPARTGVYGRRPWLAVLAIVLAPLLGVGGYLLAKQVDAPEPVATTGSLPPAPRVEPPVAPLAHAPVPATPSLEPAEVRPVPSPSSPSREPVAQRLTPRPAAGKSDPRMAAVRAKIKTLRTKTLALDENQRRALNFKLNGIFASTQVAGANVEELAQDLSDLEKDYFASAPGAHPP